MTAPSSTPTIINLALPLDNTEYSTALPDGTKRFEMQARSSAAVRWSWSSGEAVSGTYATLKADDAYESPPELWGGASLTLYFAHSAGASVTMEIIAWR